MRWQGGKLAMLIDAETPLQAMEFGPEQAESAGYSRAVAESAVEYPPSRRRLATQAITDD